MKLLLVVDLLKGFLDKGYPLSIRNCDADTEAYKERVSKYIKRFNGRKAFISDSHHPGDVEFKIFPEHCIKETEGQKIIEGINPLGYYRLQKRSYTEYSIFERLKDLIQDIENVEEIVIVGVCTHICIHDTVALIANEFKIQFNKIAPITIYKNLVDDFDPEMANFALKRMKNLYAINIVE